MRRASIGMLLGVLLAPTAAQAGNTDEVNAGLDVTLTGGAAHKLIAAGAPRFAAVLGQKLAAQTVPVLGAFTGAGVNYLYTRYYQEIAHVHFGLRRLAVAADMTEPELILLLSKRMDRRSA